MISLTPAKIELTVTPGQSANQTIILQNDTAANLIGEVEIEDFGPAHYSLNRFIIPGVREFGLAIGEKRALPFTIAIPESQGPGGLYSAITIGFRGVSQTKQATTISQLKSLIFVKIPGKTKEAGELIDFSQTNNSLYLTFQNTGNIYLNPYGVITLRGQVFNPRRDTKKELTIPVDPWYVLPGETRIREIEIAPFPQVALGYGYYDVEVSLNRGYQDIIDTRTITFWILPPVWVIIIVGIIFLTLIILILRRFIFPHEGNPRGLRLC